VGTRSRIESVKLASDRLLGISSFWLKTTENFQKFPTKKFLCFLTENQFETTQNFSWVPTENISYGSFLKTREFPVVIPTKNSTGFGLKTRLKTKQNVSWFPAEHFIWFLSENQRNSSGSSNWKFPMVPNWKPVWNQTSLGFQLKTSSNTFLKIREIPVVIPTENFLWYLTENQFETKQNVSWFPVENFIWFLPENQRIPGGFQRTHYEPRTDSCFPPSQSGVTQTGSSLSHQVYSPPKWNPSTNISHTKREHPPSINKPLVEKNTHRKLITDPKAYGQKWSRSKILVAGYRRGTRGGGTVSSWQRANSWPVGPAPLRHASAPVRIIGSADRRRRHSDTAGARLDQRNIRRVTFSYSWTHSRRFSFSSEQNI